VRLGFIDDAIAHHASEVRAELLVMGTHARRGAARMFLGSVAERTIRAAPCPTLVVPPDPLTRLARAKAPSGPLRLTVAVDLSLASDSALSWLRTHCQRVPCELRLIHMYWPPREHELLGLGPPVAVENEPEVVEVLSRGLRAHMLAELGRDDLPLRLRPWWGDEENPLAWEAETDDADLLVVGTSRARSTTAVSTVRGSRVPVLCVPARAARTEKPALAPIRNVLVTTDFSTLGDSAIPEAYRLLTAGRRRGRARQRRRGPVDGRRRPAERDREQPPGAGSGPGRQPRHPDADFRDRGRLGGRGHREGDPALQPGRGRHGLARALRDVSHPPRLGHRARRPAIAEAAARGSGSCGVTAR
jgi:hypothetical protein